LARSPACPTPPRELGKQQRPSLKGKRLPTLKQVLHDQERVDRSSDPGLVRTRSDGDREVVCPSLASGGDLSQSVCPPQCGDTATVAGLGDRAHHTCLVGALLAGHALGTSVGAMGSAPCPQGCVIREAMSDFFGCVGGCAVSVVAPSRFSYVAIRCRHGENVTLATEKIHGYRLLYGLRPDDDGEIRNLEPAVVILSNIGGGPTCD